MRILGKQGCFWGIACLVIGLFAPPASAAKHVILMISDGQGMGTVMATDFYNGNRAVYESFEGKYAMTTYSALGTYEPELGWRLFGSHLLNPTDSAAAATAMAIGVKTYPGMLGKSPLFMDMKNMVETASTQGLATGVVTSVEVSHATPAGMVAHNISRNNYEQIAAQMIYDSDLDVIMGAGHPMFDNNGNPRLQEREYRYVGGEEVFEDLTDSDGARAKDGRYWSFMDERADFEALAQGTLSAGKVFGLARAATTLQQGREGNPQVVNESNRNPSVPSLSDMTLGAIQALSDDPDGFFLMVEGGAVDWANHSNEKGRMIEEQSAFNAAVSEVVAWVEENSNWEETLLIVTADHECGYLWGTDERAFVPVGDNGAGNLPAMVFHADTHSNVPVPCYVKGTGAGPFLDGLVDGTDPFFAELFSGFDPGFSGAFIDNTDLFLLMSRWLEGEDEGTNGAGHWFKGDLHAHSLHSDGNAPVAAVLNSAEHKELDFFVLTEHDTDMFDSEDPGPVMPTHWDDPDYTSEETVLLYGVEWTTGKGHANAWATAPFDYTPLWHANTGLDAVAAVYGAHDGDALFSINHPSAIFCCPWEYDVDNAVDTIEIWNSMYRIPNLNGWSSHPFWDAELLKGRRMTGVGGSDTHKLAEYASDPFAKIEAALFGHGNPTTWVYAEEKTGDAILRSLKNGHVSLSYAPDAERLDLVADRDGDGYFETLMGDNLIQTPGRELSFQIDIRNPAPPGWFAVPRVKELTPENLVKLAAGEVDLPALLGLLAGKDTYLVGVLKNGIPHRAWIVSGGATRVTFDDVPASRGRTYYRAELMGTPDLLLFQRLLYGRVKAVTNPIYVNFPAR